MSIVDSIKRSDVVDTALQKDAKEDKNLKDAKANRPTLKNLKGSRAAKHIKKRWDRLDKVMKRKQAELKVNYLRYLGNMHAQVHPRNKNRVLNPSPTDKRQPPVLNKLRRSVHRYVAQVTADEPIIEAVPATHDNEARDAAEAATHALAGEWQRMSLQMALQRAAHLACIFRSAFWFFEWDDTAGGRQKARKFFKDEDTGERYVSLVDSRGQEVDDPSEAATIWQGDTTVEVMTPMNVRWTGARYAHNADELMVGKIVRLRQLYESVPKTRKMSLDKLLGSVPREAEKWLQDIRGENFRSSMSSLDDIDLTELTGENLEDDSSLLDQPVFLLHYFLPESRRYTGGFHGIVAGKTLVFKGSLRYGEFPIAHFKLTDEVSEPLGVALVDMLKDPQELLDFIRGQILRHLQMMRRRWFLPQQANVSARDLMNPDKTVIEYNARSGAAPEAETQPEISKSAFDFMEVAEGDFNDIFGLHDTAQGKHVPGVSSGRHAEALRQGDETLLGLTRQQFQEALEQAGLVMLNMMKKEWTTERRVRYMGEQREYIDKAFSRTDFGGTAMVRLKESTLLMLSKSQRLETIFSYAEMGVLTPEQVRRLAPLADTAGINLDEDEHVQAARRQNERFLEGPSDEAEDAWETFKGERDRLRSDLEVAQRKAQRVGPETMEPLIQEIETQVQVAQDEFNDVVSNYLPLPGAAEQMSNVAVLHAKEHARALANPKTNRLPDWWVSFFVDNHFLRNLQAAQPPQPAGEGEGEEAQGGLGPGEIEAATQPGEMAPAGVNNAQNMAA